MWVKTTYPDQLDYWGEVNAPAGNQTRVSSVAGTYTITVLPALAAITACEFYFLFSFLQKVKVTQDEIRTRDFLRVKQAS